MLEVEGFFTAAPEHERIPALQADDTTLLTGEGYQKIVDFILRHRMAVGLLADIDPGRAGGNQIENFLGNQAVIDNHIGFLQKVTGLHRQQSRIPWPRADEIDLQRRDSHHFGVSRVQP